MSLIDRFPVEIAARVFRFCVPDSTDPSWIKCMAAPLVLGAVNRTWREIAWTTPQLWTSLYIKITPKTIMLRTELAIEWLARSGQLPLSIAITMRLMYAGQISAQSLFPLIDSISGYASRWRMLDITLPKSSLSRFIGDPLGTSQLEALNIVAIFTPGLPEPDYTFSLGNMKPRPKQVCITQIPLKSLDIHWDSLTWLSASGLCIDESLNILRQAELLQFCNLDLTTAGASENDGIPKTPLIHRHIRTLGFCCYANPPSLFFDSLILPSLEELDYEFLGDDDFPDESLISFFTRSSCLLRRFTLSDCSINQGKFVPVLYAVPSLQHLVLGVSEDFSDICISDQFFQHFQHSKEENTKDEDGGKHFLPQLETFDYTGPRHFSWESLTGFADYFHSSFHSGLHLSTIPSSQQLRTIRIKIYHGEDDHIEKKSHLSLLHLRDAGLNITISTEGFDSDNDKKVRVEVNMLKTLQ